MRPTFRVRPSRALMLIAMTLALVSTANSGGEVSVDLSGLDAWKAPLEGWSTVASVTLDSKDQRKLAVEPGSGLIYNGPTGKTRNLISKEEFGDVELHVEFLIPKGSNSGVKFQTVYEIQIFDSHGTTRKPSGRENGGVYPRSEEKPVYHQIDNGYAPMVNASRPAGEWQVLNATFLAPRFDASGKKIASARISATLNGKTIHDNLEVPTPTGSAWHNPEKSTGPILIQADHGPVAFRSIKARRLETKP